MLNPQRPPGSPITGRLIFKKNVGEKKKVGNAVVLNPFYVNDPRLQWNNHIGDYHKVTNGILRTMGLLGIFYL